MSIRLNNRVFLLFFGLTSSFPVCSQSSDFPYEIKEYDFIHYDDNRFQFSGDSSLYQHFLARFSKLIGEGSGQISVVHIGGSHLQADLYTDRIRSRFQTFQPGINGGRGFVFPYAVARTNNPPNYLAAYTGKWSSCKNIQENKKCLLGLSGISVTTIDTAASITITFPPGNAVSYDFNRVKVFYQADPLSFDCTLRCAAIVTVSDKTTPGCITYLLDSYSDSLTLRLEKTSNVQQRFTLYGISLETDDPGLIYHTAGVNGAKIPSFLRCSLLPDHLAILSADLVVLSLGTNDAYTRYFNPEIYRQNYDTLIRKIRAVLPEAAILLTVPNDGYLYGRYTNNNTDKVREVIRDLARKHHCGVWDFYGIMGGLNSIIVWQRFGLAKRDRIHFTREGYRLQGDLFFNAFLKSYDDYIESVIKDIPL
jgi:lysophospholipase L1-like esterase